MTTHTHGHKHPTEVPRSSPPLIEGKQLLFRIKGQMVHGHGRKQPLL